MARKTFAVLVTAVFCASACNAAAEDLDLPMMLTIDGKEIGEARTGRDVRRLLARCNPPRICKHIGLEREPQIWYGVSLEPGGYTIVHRSGPPGPLWDARRKGRGPVAKFSTKEMITITADYIEGKETPFVRWKSKDLFSE